MYKNDVKIAKRYNNNKRKYLLINSIQAKHIPVSPTIAIKMMDELGAKLVKKYPDTKFVIGFAETATAIGAEVAKCFGDKCQYIQTTRENILNTVRCIEFYEEHSHAVNQWLYSDKIDEWLNDKSPIIFIDDELTTGKTLINVVNKLKKEFKNVDSRKFIAASIVNRVSDENINKMKRNGIVNEYLFRFDESDYSEIIDKIQICEPIMIKEKSDKYREFILSKNFINPRLGCNIYEYHKQCIDLSNETIKYLKNDLKNLKDVLVIGTEECMYPAVILGREIEQMFNGCNVYTHSTTRSPIGICQDSDYPINSGYIIPSFYDVNRKTYIYNLNKYDMAIVVTDSCSDTKEAMQKLCDILNEYRTNTVVLVRGEKNV